MKYLVTKSIIQVIGKIWMPSVTCAMQYDLDSYALGNIEGYRRELNLDWREAIEHWVSLNTGDFQTIEDFRADIETSEENVVFNWKSEDSEMTYNDCMFGSDDD